MLQTSSLEPDVRAGHVQTKHYSKKIQLHCKLALGHTQTLSHQRMQRQMSREDSLLLRNVRTSVSSPSSQQHGSSSSPARPADFSLLCSSMWGLASTSNPATPTLHQHTVGPALVVFSGGTAFNSVAGHLRRLTTRVTHVLPVSDDGGSTAEIVRVLGGPAVGDIRSRCLRLADSSNDEACAVKTLLAHRLPSTDSGAAKLEWYSIVEGCHALWQGMSEPYKHVIRAFLVHFHSQILAHSGSEPFDFKNGSVGNFFFAGCRTFFRSLDSAVFLFSRVGRIPEGSLVVPAIRTEGRITLGAELEDGSVIRGQNQISHPSDGGASTSVDKSSGGSPPLPAPVRRIFYLSSEGGDQEHEVFPAANPVAVTELAAAEAIIYGMGSLYTSICPCICLAGVGEAVAAREVPKVLLLNGSHDRETSRSSSDPGAPMSAADIVQAVCDALNRRHSRKGDRLHHPPSAYITGVIIPRGGGIPVDLEALAALGIHHVLEADTRLDSEIGQCVFEPSALVDAIHQMLCMQGVHHFQQVLSPQQHHLRPSPQRQQQQQQQSSPQRQ